ncbi:MULTISPECIES: hypothetical protein [Ruminococcus]|jgi:hypothetical protein|uniref:hypothetical protein n=1 Tax=Ruminococcus TaxID=1263 RepID=UPI003A98013E
MNLKVDFTYEEKYLRTSRCRKPLARTREGIYELAIKELAKAECPIAAVVHDMKSVYEGATTTADFEGNGEYKMFAEPYRVHNGKFYKFCRASYGAAISTAQTELKYVIADIKSDLYRYSLYEKENLFSDKSVYISDNLSEIVDNMQARANKYISLDGELWKECGEPRYVVNTFGLGHNHGGTAMFIEEFYNSNISSKNYFNAVDRDKAITYAKETAIARGDTDSVKRIGKMENIEVLIPEFFKVDPEKEHGEGNAFLNLLEDMVTSSNNATEAGILVTLATASEINKN